MDAKEFTKKELGEINRTARKYHIPVKAAIEFFTSHAGIMDDEDEDNRPQPSMMELINRRLGQRLNSNWLIRKTYRNDFEGYLHHEAVITGIDGEWITLDLQDQFMGKTTHRTEQMHYLRFNQSIKDQVAKYKRAKGTANKFIALKRIADNMFMRFQMHYGEEPTKEFIKKYIDEHNFQRFFDDVIDEWVLFVRAAKLGGKTKERNMIFEAARSYHPLMYKGLPRRFWNRVKAQKTLYIDN